MALDKAKSEFVVLEVSNTTSNNNNKKPLSFQKAT